jgi:hypothetical protein
MCPFHAFNLVTKVAQNGFLPVVCIYFKRGCKLQAVNIADVHKKIVQ